MPLISIITINYNNVDGLKKTFDSVTTQTNRDFEYVVIDGGSKDGSTDVINFYKDSIDYWVSEPDKGIYHAMNKGVKKAQGEYLLFLNSGDYLHDPATIENVIPLLSGEDIISGNLIHTNGDNTSQNSPPGIPTFDFFVISSLPHPATFIKKLLFDKVGLYDEGLKICSDWKFFMDAIIKENCSYKRIELCISLFNEDGISSNPANRLLIENERRQVIVHEYGSYLYDYYSSTWPVITYAKQSRLIRFLQRAGLLKGLKSD